MGCSWGVGKHQIFIKKKQNKKKGEEEEEEERQRQNTSTRHFFVCVREEGETSGLCRHLGGVGAALFCSEFVLPPPPPPSLFGFSKIKISFIFPAAHFGTFKFEVGVRFGRRGRCCSISGRPCVCSWQLTLMSFFLASSFRAVSFSGRLPSSLLFIRFSFAFQFHSLSSRCSFRVCRAAAQLFTVGRINTRETKRKKNE